MLGEPPWQQAAVTYCCVTNVPNVQKLTTLIHPLLFPLVVLGLVQAQLEMSQFLTHI